jgi:hypothetical protein
LYVSGPQIGILATRVSAIVTDSEPKRHHYVPQFYMRRFACPGDPNKVMVIERHVVSSVFSGGAAPSSLRICVCFFDIARVANS